MSDQRVDVAVVGGTTAGLAAALGLAHRGLSVALVDSGDDSGVSWTAIHHWSVLPLLDRLGVLDEAMLQGEATARWALRVLATGEQLDFDLRELSAHVRFAFNLRLEPQRLRRILMAALDGSDGSSVIDEGPVTGLSQGRDGVALSLASGRTVTAGWVVGADGPGSAIRRLAGLGFEGTTWTERAVVALVEHDFARHGYADTTFQVDGRAGAVVERVDQETWRYVFQESLALDERQISDRIGHLLRESTGELPRVLDWSASRMHQRSATSYRSGRVLLVGEAAHVTHPMTGYSSVSGWYDAATVVSALMAARRGDVQAVTAWAEKRRRHFMDDAAPTSLSRRNLVAQIEDPRRLDMELDSFRRATQNLDLRLEMLLAEGGAGYGAGATYSPF